MIESNATSPTTNNTIECDDSSSLLAALAAIDEWDLDFGFLFESDPSLLPSQEPPTMSKETTQQRNPTSIHKASSSASPYTGRNRRKLEIQALREQSIDLERQLVLVQRAVFQAAPNKITTTESEILTAAWQQCALRQQTQREVVEEENGKLRKLLGALVPLAHQLLDTCRRVQVPTGLLPITLMKSLNFDWQTMTTVDHLMELDQLYTNMFRIFDKPCFTSDRREFQDIQIVDDTYGHVITFEMALVFPFESDRVAEALWHEIIRMSSNQRVFEFQDLVKESSSLVSLFAGISKTHSFEMIMQGQIATRRYASGETRAIVSKVVSEILVPQGESMAMVRECWLRCLPIHQGTRGDGTMRILTQVHWNRRIRIQCTNESFWHTLPISTEEMTSCVRQTVAWNVQSVENQLLA